MKKVSFFKKCKVFFKRNSYSVVAGVCVFAIISAVAITAVVKLSGGDEEGILPVNNMVGVVDNYSENIDNYADGFDEQTTDVSSSAPIVFSSPLKEYTLGLSYAMDSHVFNETLNEWSTHSGVDYIGASGSEVLSVYDGTVESVSYSVLDGTVVVIKHTDSLSSVYKSLSSEIVISVGQSVKKGDVIGYISDSMGTERKTGAHLHFEILENGTNVDPMKYVSIASK